MNAAGSSSPPAAGSSIRPAGRHSHRSGRKHHSSSKLPYPPREKKPPPPPSCKPCVFGVACWFRGACSHQHSAEDFAQWEKQKQAKATLIQFKADQQKARLAARAARRSALSPITNTPPVTAGVDAGSTPAQVHEKTAAPTWKEKHKKQTAIVNAATVQSAHQHAQDTWDSLFTNKLVTAKANSAYFQAIDDKDKATLNKTSAGKHLIQHGTDWCFWTVAKYEDDNTVSLTLSDSKKTKLFHDVLSKCPLWITLDNLKAGIVQFR